MAPYDEVFARLQATEGTRNLARSLHTQVAELTKHGSGRSLGHGHNALSAICAYLASQKLGNGDVTRDQARAAACVDRKTFDSTLLSVERILPDTSSGRHNQMNITYRSLLKQYVAREDAYVPMVEVEDALKGVDASVDGNEIEVKSSLMQCVIFHWVCTAILRVIIPDVAYLRQMVHASPKKWSICQRTVEKHCSHLIDDLVQKAEIALSARRTRSQTRSRLARGVDATPTRSTASPGKLSVLSMLGIPTPERGIKRKMSPELDSKENARPCKRTTPMGLKQHPPIHTPKTKASTMTSHSIFSQPASQTMDGYESDEAPCETIVVQSARPSRKQLDRSPWDSQCPASTTIERDHLPAMPLTQITPSVNTVAFTTTPLTSTGMSETSSPNPPLCPSDHVRMSSASKAQHPLIQLEELSRRRRRNLRAAFLDPGAYGWNPTAYTKQNLHRARKWEALMTSKYGDPWDAR